MLRKANKTGLASAVAVFLLVPAMARANLIQDASFDSGGTGTPWVDVNFEIGYYYHTADNCAVIGAPAGSAGYQTLSDTFQTNTQYDMSFWAAHNNNDCSTGTTGVARFQLGYVEASTFNLVYEVSGHPGNYPAPASYVQLTGVYNTGSAGTEIGKAITVRFLNGSADTDNWDPYWFDDILLTPEPTTMLLLLAGGVAALLRRRR